jgi:hypothetical protein
MQIHKVYWPYSASFSICLHLLSPTSSHLLTGSVLHSCPSLFKFIFIVQRGFTMACHLWIHYTLIRLTPFITLPSLFPFSVFCYAFLQHTCNVFQYYSLSIISLFLTPSLILTDNVHQFTILISQKNIHTPTMNSGIWNILCLSLKWWSWIAQWQTQSQCIPPRQQDKTWSFVTNSKYSKKSQSPLDLVVLIWQHVVLWRNLALLVSSFNSTRLMLNLWI